MGAPLISGGESPSGGGVGSSAGMISMLNGGSALPLTPSLTLMTMPVINPVSPLAGVPESSPVVGSKLAQEGLVRIEKVKRSPSGSFADGLNKYLFPSVTCCIGIPEILGALLLTVPGLESSTGTGAGELIVSS